MRTSIYLAASLVSTLCAVPALALGFELAALLNTAWLIPVPVLAALGAAWYFGTRADLAASYDFIPVGEATEIDFDVVVV